MRVSPTTIVMLMGAGMDPSFSSHPKDLLLRAARDGDVRQLRKAFLKTPVKEIDLDAALCVAAARDELPAVVSPAAGGSSSFFTLKDQEMGPRVLSLMDLEKYWTVLRNVSRSWASLGTTHLEFENIFWFRPK